MKQISCGRIPLVAGGILLWLGLLAPATADKVTLSADNWALKEGQACIDCHKKSSPGLTHQWQDSAHAETGVNCLDCHQADPSDDDSFEHEGSIIATIVSPKDCGRCHTTEFAQTEASVHSKALLLIEGRMPALSDRTGQQEMLTAGCNQCHGSRIEVRGDGTLTPESWPNTGIGRINPDGSRGSCSACHGRHQFSKAQARDPSACSRCHSGSESPDAEVYQSSKHGMLFSVHRDKLNLASDQWVTGADYSAAPTCVTCHMGASPGLKSTHDVGMRQAWNLNGPVSEKQYLIIFQDGDRMELPASQPAPRRGSDLTKSTGETGKVKAVADPKRRRQAMSKVCLECHSKGFTKGSFKQFDDLIRHYNEAYGKPAQSIMQVLYERKLLTRVPFDDPLEFTYWQLWHDQGTQARHGAAMASPSIAWEGMRGVAQIFYNSFLPQVRALAGEAAGSALIEQVVTGQPAHGWLQNPARPNPILGYGTGANIHE